MVQFLSIEPGGLDSELPLPGQFHRVRVSAVSYLNTSPLVWGLLHGNQRGRFDLRFELPGLCADSVQAGTADIGLVPVIEVERQKLEMVPGLGIASDGPVRSILLISKVPLREIRSVAMDDGSRTSVALTRIILAERYGVHPIAHSMRPSVENMLLQADAALLIGDPALQFDLKGCAYDVHDLGTEWQELTGLPMVYAVWAGRAGTVTAEIAETFQRSYNFGQSQLPEIIRVEAARRGLEDTLAIRYLTEHIAYELGPRHYDGLRRFLELARSARLTA